jgi:EmrB/QacA subfamily drug resistance transporter
MASTASSGSERAVIAGAARVVLLTLASAQFLMTLDSSVMNVSIQSVANDLGTTVTGIQTAITLYTLVMASLMILGGKLGDVLGRRRAFSIGLVIYGFGSFVTAISPNLTVLLFGWSFLEGIGAVLILPAIVALVAGNFEAKQRPAAYGMIAAAGAVAVAAGPIIGGAVTTFFSWRWVFLGEDVLVVVILLLTRRIEDAPPAHRPKIDFFGALLSAAGLAFAVFGVLKSSTWGWVQPKPNGPVVLGASPTIWLIFGGLLLLWGFFEWETRLEQRGAEPLVRPSLFRVSQLTSGLTMFAFQFFLQAGVFFTIPLFLSVVLEMSALATGARLLPLSIALLAAAIGIPRFWPQASPRRVVRIGLVLLIAGTAVLVGGLSLEATAAVVAIPLLLVGLGIGALASQLGAVTVSSLPDERSAEVGGLQNTATNLGASLGTALVGSVLIATLTAGVVAGLQQHPETAPLLTQQATVQLDNGVPFLSDSALRTTLQQANVPSDTTEAIIDVNSQARIAALKTALSAVVLVGILGLLLSVGIPLQPVGAASETPREADATEGPPIVSPATD